MSVASGGLPHDGKQPNEEDVNGKGYKNKDTHVRSENGTVGEHTRINAKYSVRNKGPFSEWIQSKRNLPEPGKKSLGLSKFKVGKVVCEKYHEVDFVESESKYRVEVILKTREAANELAIDQELADYGWEAIIPPFRVSRKGIMRNIDVAITEEEIVKYAEASARIIEARRMKRRVRNLSEDSGYEWAPTKSMIITFVGQELPSELYIYKIKNEIHPYVATPLFCNRCFKPGHSSKVCKAAKKCMRCGNEDHDAVECNADKPKCVNCSGVHLANDKKCIIFAKEFEVRRLMAQENISLNQAKRLVYNKSNMPGPDISKENFPRLYNNTRDKLFSNVVREGVRVKEHDKSKVNQARGGDKSLQNRNNSEDPIDNQNNVMSFKEQTSRVEGNKQQKSNQNQVEQETAEYLLQLSKTMGYNPTIKESTDQFNCQASTEGLETTSLIGSNTNLHAKEAMILKDHKKGNTQQTQQKQDLQHQAAFQQQQNH